MVDIAYFLKCRYQCIHIIAMLHITVIQSECVEQIRLCSAARGAQPGECPVHAAEITGDRHLIVVENNNEIAALLSGVIQAFKCHARA